MWLPDDAREPQRLLGPRRRKRAGHGTEACPYATITAALAIANTSATIAPITLHVDPGTYDAALGETFPIVLRKGISLVGNVAQPPPSARR